MRLIRLLKKDLAREMADWVARDLISDSQAEAIGRLYGIDYRQSDSAASGYRLLTALGYLFIGLALITLIGANWQDIPRALRLAGLVTLTLSTHGLAIRSWRHGNTAGASGLFLLGNLFYGASIILIAQIYHLGEHMPDGVFWWALGSLPFGVLLLSHWLTLFSCLLALLWFAIETSLGFFPAALPVFIVAGSIVLWKGQQSTLLFLTVSGSAILWVEALFAVLWADAGLPLQWQPGHVMLSVALFILAWAASARLHQGSPAARDYGAVLAVWCLRFGLLTLFVLSYEEAWRSLIRADWPYAMSLWSITIALLCLALWLARRTAQAPAVAALAGFALLSMMAVMASDDLQQAVYFQLVYNIVLIGSGIGLIVRGIHHGVSHYFFAGIGTILLTALLRYIDLIGEYIGGAALFMLMAIILLAAARYWQHQQQHKETAA
ncbi:MAG TPA: DUF2157 domain-containing protein [Pseudomonadales bacterium]